MRPYLELIACALIALGLACLLLVKFCGHEPCRAGASITCGRAL